MKTLNYSDDDVFIVQVNHRKLLDGLFGACGVPAENFRPICSAVDKLDKSPWCEVRKEMVDEKGLDPQVADRIGEYVKLNGKQEMLDTLKNDERLKDNADAQVRKKSYLNIKFIFYVLFLFISDILAMIAILGFI